MTVSPDRYDPETALLSAEGMYQALEIELARASRHEVPLSYVLIDVALSETGADVKVSFVATRIAEVLLGGVRTEDYVGRVGELRFAVLATEGVDADTLAQRLSDHVRKHVGAMAGTEPTIAAAGVDCQYDEMTREQLVHQAETDLASAILAATGKQVPVPSPCSSPVGNQLPKAS